MMEILLMATATAAVATTKEWWPRFDACPLFTQFIRDQEDEKDY
jgi:hypothetical protein